MHHKHSCWKDKLKDSGCRLTLPRKVIFDALNSTAKHLSAEDIYFMIHKKYPGIGLTTVYRTLDMMVGMRLVDKFDFGDGHSRYESLEAQDKQHHHHLICTKCGKVVDYTDFIKEETKLVKSTEEKLSKKYNFKISNHIFQFHGLCYKCKK